MEIGSGSSCRSHYRRRRAAGCRYCSRGRIADACRDGVSAGFEHLSVASLEATAPYRLPRLVDTAGNNNGSVCGHALPDSVRDADCKNGGPVACILGQLGLPLYRFTDDDNPANQNAQADR